MSNGFIVAKKVYFLADLDGNDISGERYSDIKTWFVNKLDELYIAGKLEGGRGMYTTSDLDKKVKFEIMAGLEVVFAWAGL